MKHCPRCQSTYTDDTLQFCLQDGSVLVNAAAAVPETPAPDAAAATGGNQLEAPTVVRQQQPVDTGQNQFAPPAAPKKSSTGLVIFLTALVTLLLFGGGIVAWYLLQNRGAAEVAINSNAGNSPAPSNRNSSDANRGNANASPSPTPSNSNTNSNSNNAPSVNAAQIKSEVSDKVNDWAAAIESGNLNAHLSSYADRLDYYYNARDVGIGAIRSDKQRAFGSFDDFRMEISNLRVTPDASGEKATAVFDKEWEFEGEDNRNKGKVQSQLQLTKIGGVWRITGERDLKIYYTER
jgi:ketosteroid isomerase-like protein